MRSREEAGGSSHALLFQVGAVLAKIAPPQPPQEADQEQQSQHGRDAQQVQDGGGVFGGGRIVMVAEQQNLIRSRANPVLRRLDQTSFQVFRLKLHTVKIAGSPALRREHHDAASVQVDVVVRIVPIMKADRIGERANVRLGSGEEMPARRTGLGGIKFYVIVPLGTRQGWPLARVDTDGDHVEITAGPQRQGPKTHDDPVEDLIAEHRALVIDQRENCGLLAEIVPETNVAAGFVPELRAEGDLRIEILVEANAVKYLRGRARSRAAGGRNTRRDRENENRPHRGSGSTFPSNQVSRVPASGL